MSEVQIHLNHPPVADPGHGRRSRIIFRDFADIGEAELGEESEPISVADPGFPRRRAPTSKIGVHTYYLAKFFPQNCMKRKEFGPEGACLPGTPLRFANECWQGSRTGLREWKLLHYSLSNILNMHSPTFPGTFSSILNVHCVGTFRNIFFSKNTSGHFDKFISFK